LPLLSEFRTYLSYMLLVLLVLGQDKLLVQGQQLLKLLVDIIYIQYLKEKPYLSLHL